MIRYILFSLLFNRMKQLSAVWFSIKNTMIACISKDTIDAIILLNLKSHFLLIFIYVTNLPDIYYILAQKALLNSLHLVMLFH